MNLQALLRNSSQQITAIVALISFPIIWVTYYSNWRKTIDDKKEEKKRLLQAMQIDLDIMHPWTGPYPTEDVSWYIQRPNYNSWYMPSRIIYKFPHSSFLEIVKSSHLFSEDLVQIAASLDQKISSLEQQLDNLKQFVFSRPDLYQQTSVKLTQYSSGQAIINNDIFSEEERNYICHIFSNNYIIHVRIIGNVDDPQSIVYSFNKLTEMLPMKLAELEKDIEINALFRIFTFISWVALIFGGLMFILLLINIYYLFFL